MGDGRIDKRLHHFVGGEWRRPSTSEYGPVFNPADGSLIAEAALGSAEDIDEAVCDSERAFREWQRTLPSQRSRILISIARALRERSEEFAKTETLDNGKPLSQARGDVEGAARYFEFFGGAADKLNGDTIPLSPEHLAYTVREPYGVTGHILPWNAPLLQASRGIAPALAAGNTAVVKPAEDTPMSALALAELAVGCGLPPGVLNVVTGIGEVAGASLSAHAAVRKVAFTGSVATGRIVAQVAAERLLPLTLELGGKSANIVFADADLGAAVAGAARGINTNAGQNCSAGSRVLVQESVYEQFAERLAAINETVTIGPGIDDPDMGPITTVEQFDRVRAYLEIGETEGATRISGGDLRSNASADGLFVRPTIFTGINNGMRIAREEIFGPVVGLMKFADDDEAIAIANDSEFGLVAGLWSSNLSRVHRVATALQVGQVYVNEYFAGLAGGVETPFGGTKNSGFGREKGLEALLYYSQSKSVVIRL